MVSTLRLFQKVPFFNSMEAAFVLEGYWTMQGLNTWRHRLRQSNQEEETDLIEQNQNVLCFYVKTLNCIHQITKCRPSFIVF